MSIESELRQRQMLLKLNKFITKRKKKKTVIKMQLLTFYEMNEFISNQSKSGRHSVHVQIK